MKQKFIDFLKRERMLETFEMDLSANPTGNIDVLFDLAAGDNEHLIAGAFDWSATDTGLQKYRHLHDKWAAELESMTKGGE